MPPYTSSAPGGVPPYGSNVPPPLYQQNNYPVQPGAFGNQYGNQYPQQYAYGHRPNTYVQAGYYGAVPQSRGLSITSLVSGIVSFLMGWLLVPPLVAIITGHLALRREPLGKGMAIAGLVLGYLCLLVYGAFWILVAIGLAFLESASYVNA